ncbi:unnamed protein product [Prorocentrum cordatum]|uniref:Peptidylprolyl isomerase n=1 Tax=Prorocentrum cordatum TaxID=2364126 RepID=A0ABN9QZ32_9DINO|nr:unnamed protein product [Polarella glacialis]
MDPCCGRAGLGGQVEILPQPEYGTARPWEAPAVFDVQLTELTTREFMGFRSPSSFKHKYTLLNTHGAKVDEPDEETMGELDATRRSQAACCKNMCFFLWLISRRPDGLLFCVHVRI